MRHSVKQFETAFAEYHSAGAARAFWMGRVGLYAVLKALGVGPDDRVGICSYTCLGVIEAITRLNAKLVFLDVDRHMNIAPSSLEKESTPLKALIIQHTFGVPCRVDAMLSWARARNIPVIEDSCHALGATWESQRIGSFGAASIFSFQWGKPISAGQGGMVTFPSAHLAHEVDRVVAREGVAAGFGVSASLSVQRKLHRWLVTPATRRALGTVYQWACRRGLVSGSQPRAESLIGEVNGFLKLMSAGQARAGLAAFRRWPETMQRRMDAAAFIRDRLKRENISVEPPDPRSAPMYLRLPIWIRHKQAILEAAERSRLDIAGWYSTPAHPLKGESLEALGYDLAVCPGAEAAFEHVVTLPTYPALSPDQLDAAVRIIQTQSEGR